MHAHTSTTNRGTGFLPVFLRSTTRRSRDRHPAPFNQPCRPWSQLHNARDTANRTAPAWPPIPPPRTTQSTCNCVNAPVQATGATASESHELRWKYSYGALPFIVNARESSPAAGDDDDDDDADIADAAADAACGSFTVTTACATARFRRPVPENAVLSLQVTCNAFAATVSGADGAHAAPPRSSCGRMRRSMFRVVLRSEGGSSMACAGNCCVFARRSLWFVFGENAIPLQSF